MGNKVQWHWVAKDRGGRKLTVVIPKPPHYTPTLEKIVLEGREKNLNIMKKYASVK